MLIRQCKIDAIANLVAFHLERCHIAHGYYHFVVICLLVRVPGNLGKHITPFIKPQISNVALNEPYSVVACHFIITILYLFTNFVASPHSLDGNCCCRSLDYFLHAEREWFFRV